eukprot:gene17256-20565_t
MLGVSAKDGIVDMAMRVSKCSFGANAANGSSTRCFELLVMGYDMVLRRFHLPPLGDSQAFPIHPVNSTDPTLSEGCHPATHPINVSRVHHSVGCISFCPQTDILAVGGNRRTKGLIKPHVSMWRLSDSAPYATLINGSTVPGRDFDTSIDGGPPPVPVKKSIIKRVTSSIFGEYSPGIIVHKLRFSEDGSQLLSLDLAGTISRWVVLRSPSTKPTRQWPTQELAHIWNKAGSDVVDMAWWGEDKIIAANRAGEFVIFSMVDTANCLLHDPETVSSTQPPVLTASHNGRFFILETSGLLANSRPSLLATSQEMVRERVGVPLMSAYKFVYRYFYGDHPADLDPLHFHVRAPPHQPLTAAAANRENEERRITRRIIKFQSTTPEQLFRTKVAQKEYNTAIIIAEHYGLDKDLVHQKRWSKSIVSADSIRSYLVKVHDLDWVLWESHTRIPRNYDGTHQLLEYALQKSSSIMNSSSSIDILKLAVYKEINGTSFDAIDFLRFRSCNLVLAGMEYASTEHFKAIETLLSYHAKEILPARLALLELIPETTDPRAYERLMPDASNLWSPKKAIEADWSQSREIFENVLALDYEKRHDTTYLRGALSALGVGYEDIRGRDQANDVYACDYAIPEPEPLSTLTRESISKWYSTRADEIDRKSGQIDNAVTLLTIAVEKGVKDLEDPLAIAEQVATVVYDTGHDVSLAHYKTLGPLDRLTLLLGDATPSNIVKIVSRRTPAICTSDPTLLVKFFEARSAATKDGVNLARAYLEATLGTFDATNQDIIEQRLNIGLSSIRACTAVDLDTIVQMERILAALPQRTQDQSRPAIHALHDRSRDYTSYVSANKLLAQSIATAMIKYGRTNKFKQSQWRTLVSDLMSIRTIVFHNSDPDALHGLVVRSLLADGQLSLAKDLFTMCGSPDRIESLVLSEARDLFSAASGFTGSSLNQAVACLELIQPPTRRIIRELNLIKATELMHAHFKYPQIPVQVRFILEKGPKSTSPRKSFTVIDPIECHPRFELIQALLDSHPTAYTSHETILTIANLLSDWADQSADSQDSGDHVPDRVVVEVMLVRKAFASKDYAVALTLCKALMLEKGIPASYSAVWRICAQLALDANACEISSRMDLLSYALFYCDRASMTKLLEPYQELEVQASISTNATTTSSPMFSPKSNHDLSILSKLHRDSKALDDLVESCPLVTLEPPYIESHTSLSSLFSDQADEWKDKKDLFYQQMRYHTHLLIGFMEKDNNNNEEKEKDRKEKDRTDNELETLSRISLQQGDLKMSMAYLIGMRNQDRASLVINELIDTTKKDQQFQTSLERVSRLAVYYYSMRLLVTRAIAENAAVAPLFARSIDAVVRAGLTVASKDTSDPLGAKVTLYNRLLIDSIQAKELHEINHLPTAQIDFERFKEDPEYKRETIFGFAHSNDARSLSTAMSMASRYGVDRGLVVESHLEWRIRQDSPTGPLLIEQSDIEALARDGRLTAIYSAIEGTDYITLAAFFDAVGSHVEKDDSSCRAKKKILSLLRSPKNKLGSKLDFKQMVDDVSYDPFDGMHDQIAEINVSFCCTIIGLLQRVRSDELIHNDTIGKIYRQLVDNLIKEGQSAIKVVTSHRKHLEDSDLSDVYKSIAIGEYSSQFQIEQRIDALGDALHVGQIKNNEQLANDIGELHSYLQTLNKLQHLQEDIGQDTVERFNSAYLTHHKAGGLSEEFKRQQVQEVITLLIRDKVVSPKTVEKVYRIIAKPDQTSDQDIGKQVVEYYRKFICESVGERASFGGVDAVRRTMAALKRVEGWEVEVRSMLEPLRTYAHDMTKPIDLRIKVLETLAANPSLYDRPAQSDLLDQDLQQLKQHKTKEIIKETWHEHQEELGKVNNEITTPETSIPLFKTLLENSTTYAHISYLSELLTMWSNVGSSSGSGDVKSGGGNGEVHVLHESWFQLLMALIQHIPETHKAINQLLRIRMDQTKLYAITQEEESKLLDVLESRDKPTMFNFGLLSNYDAIQSRSVETLVSYLKDTYGGPKAASSVPMTYCPHVTVPGSVVVVVVEKEVEEKKESHINGFVEKNQHLLRIILTQGLLENYHRHITTIKHQLYVYGG